MAKRYRLSIESGPGMLMANIDDDTTAKSITSTLTYGDNLWHHVSMVRDGNYLRLYIDGEEDPKSPIDITGYGSLDEIESFYINAFRSEVGGTLGYWSSASTDEVRVAKLALSPEWIATEYDNQNDPDSFYSVGNAYKVYVPSFNDFNYYKEITIDHTKVSGTSNLINFPVLISIFDSDLHTEVQEDGDDIAFTNGTTWLHHEIELFNQTFNETHAQLIAWVRVPSLSHSTDTKFWMYYGNATIDAQENPHGVWDSSYLGIWHLKESGSGNVDEYNDSSIYKNHGQGGEGNSSFIPTRVNGKIGYGQDFNDLDGYFDLIDCGDDPMFDITGNQITLEAWVQHNITPQEYFYGIMNHKGWYDGYSIWIEQNSLKLTFN
jgi:hypothetical protein